MSGRDAATIMPNFKTLGLALVLGVLAIVLIQLHSMALAQNLFSWGCAAAMLACGVIWGRIILNDARAGKTNYRRMTWEASPDIFIMRRQMPGKFWRLIFYKILSLLFILALCAAFVLHALGLFLVAPPNP